MLDRQPNYELIRERLRRTRRQRNLSLREVAEEIGVSASTLSRLERGTGVPDLPTLTSLATWLDVDRDTLFGVRGKTQERSTPATVEVLLRADKNLDPKTAKTLAKIFRTAYTELANE
jgi:transcriptional regulator with XRE-family HTH domain